MYRTSSWVLLMTIGLVLLVVLAESMCVAQRRQPRANPPPTTTRGTYTNIRQVDFNNFVYRIGGEQITVRKGIEIARSPQGEGGCHNEVERVAYGDLNADEKEEAVIVLACTFAPEGNGYSNAGYVYTLRQGQPVLLAEFEGGGKNERDSILGTIVANDGTLIVVKDDGNSDPPGFQAVTYKWDGRKLVGGGRSVIRRTP